MTSDQLSKEPLAVIVLAAGLGKRLGSDRPKVIAATNEKSLIQHVLGSLAPLSPLKLVVVVGHRRELVEEVVRDGENSGLYAFGDLNFAFQEQQCGTGDAVKCAFGELEDFSGTILIVCGDTPLIRTATLERLLQEHRQKKATLTLLSFFDPNPGNNYGRILRQAATSEIRGIVEARDCTPSERLVSELNSAIYAVDSAFLFPAVKELKNDNVQKEYYLTDIVKRAVSEGQRVHSMFVEDNDEAEGVNTKADLAYINEILNRRRVAALIEGGVEIADPNTVYVGAEVKVGAGSKLGPQVMLCGDTTIGANVTIEGSAYFVDTLVESEAYIKFSVRAEGAKIGKGAKVGPFANLRPQTILEENVHIGNFVETKKAHLKAGAKANHLTYLGDCEVGKSANIGAGTITCNYDGVNKHKTTIGDGVFIGSDSCLVAPVTIHDRAYIGAGSVITKDVQADSLAFTRAPLIAKAGWAKNKLKKGGS